MSSDTRMTPRKVNAPAAQRVADAWAMRVRGAGWNEIALALGYANPQNAMRAVRNYVGKLPEPSAPELRSMWRERLEYLWPIAARDAEAGKSGAVRAAVAVAQRAAQLDGLDAPQHFQIDPSSEELDRLVAELLAFKGLTPVREFDILDAEVIEDE